ncbi:MAG: beta-ketoacyl synthase N-terminal-like domain-containing protein, partial [Desulfovibrionaceae bacterium]
RAASHEPVAVIGLAVRLAGCQSLDQFWDDLRFGADRIHPLPEARRRDAAVLLHALGLEAPGAENTPEAAWLDDLAAFDHRRFRLSPADAALLDPDQRVFLETAAACLDDAGLGGEALRGRRVGVFAGASPAPLYRLAVNRLHPERAEQIFALNVPSNLATRLSFLLDWRGPAAVVDTACSSALNALHLACRALRAGECELALAGGVHTAPAPVKAGARFAIESSTARTRAFDHRADGTGEGEGCVAVLLKPLARALADGDPVHAVVLGSAVNQDGASTGMAAPNPAAQAEVILAAAEDAGVGLDSIGYVEAHGTGTRLGDPVEILGLTRAFERHGAAPGAAAIGSVKGNYGHLDAAAGLLGLAKAALVLRHGLTPPQPHFEAPNPAIDFAHAPVHVPAAAEPLATPGHGPRRAGVSSFGLSGVNCHVILEAAPGTEAPGEAPGWRCAPLSAGSPAALRRLAGDLAEALAEHPDYGPAAVARTLTLGRAHGAHRLALAVNGREGLVRGLLAFAARQAPDEAAGVYAGRASKADGMDHADVSDALRADPLGETTARALARRF